MDDIRGQFAGVGVPDLDCAIFCPGSHAATVGTEGDGANRRFVPAENPDFLSVDCLPDVNRSIVATTGQLTTVGAPCDPLRALPRSHRRRATQHQGRSFSIDVPDSDRPVAGSLGKSLAGKVPGHHGSGAIVAWL